MIDSIHPTPDTAKVPRRDQTMRSFTWEPVDGDELSDCPHCECWHALFQYDEYEQRISIREWHESGCPVWEGRD